MSDHGHQYHHGVNKNLFDLAGGLIVGAALTLLLKGLFRRQPAPQGGDATVSADAGASGGPSAKPNTPDATEAGAIAAPTPRRQPRRTSKQTTTDQD
jgi:hypothetical protein